MPRFFGMALLVLGAGCGDVLAPAPSTKDPAPEEHDAPPIASKPADPAPADPAPAPPAAAPKAPCTVAFTRDVIPVLVSSCASTLCHEDDNNPRIDAKAPKPTYDALIAKSFGSIEWSDPHPDFAEMYDPAFKDIIDTWRMCGAPFE